MRTVKITLLIFIIFLSNATAQDKNGTVIFYLFPESLEKNIEVKADFNHHVAQLKPILKKSNIAYSLQQNPKFLTKLPNGITLEFSKHDFTESIGYIMIKTDGKYLIRTGIGTDIDMYQDIIKYFGKVHNKTQEPI